MSLLFPESIGRLSFLARNVIMNLIVWPLILFYEDGPTGEGPPHTLFLWILALLITAYWVFCVGLPRCRDAALPSWILLLLLVPIANLGVSLILLGSGSKPAVTRDISPQAPPVGRP